jgi:hypothetical protein
MAVTVTGWSLLVWGLAISTNALVFRALGLRIGHGAAVVQVIVHLAPLPAHVPGRIGEHQALSILGLVPYEVEPAAQIAFAALLYAVVHGPQIVLGMGAVALAAVRSVRNRG